MTKLPIEVLITPVEKQELDARARLAGTSRSDFVRQLIQRELGRTAKPVSFVEPVDEDISLL